MKNFFLFLSIIILVLAVYFFYPRPAEEIQVSPIVEEITMGGSQDKAQDIMKKEETVSDQKTDDKVPAQPQAPTQQEAPAQPQERGTIQIEPEFSIKAPFIVQAPFANWSARYKEACEEASVLIVHNFYEGITSLTQQQMKDQIDAMADWGDERFDGRFDTTLRETAQYMIEYLGYDESRLKFVSNPTIDDLKALLFRGYPIIVPVAGRELGNKYYTPPGPIYHMLVLTGYDKNEFITNDPGTRRGEGYRYKQEVLLNAIHDWTGDYNTILSGEKIVLVVTDPL